MGLNYEGNIIEFTPSKSYLGKKISKEFAETIKTMLSEVKTDEDLSKILLEYD